MDFIRCANDRHEAQGDARHLHAAATPHEPQRSEQGRASEREQPHVNHLVCVEERHRPETLPRHGRQDRDSDDPQQKEGPRAGNANERLSSK
jgi:hypothetical protein